MAPNAYDHAVSIIAGPHADDADKIAATDSVECVFRQLVDPDDEMIQAGIFELGCMIPHSKNMPRDFQRRTIECIWRAMLEKARS